MLSACSESEACDATSRCSPYDGSARSESAREAILEAALRLLVERGYAGFAIEPAAAAAGTGKSTIYR
jgi:AcrR family transcriptional regulator